MKDHVMVLVNVTLSKNNTYLACLNPCVYFAIGICMDQSFTSSIAILSVRVSIPSFILLVKAKL